MKDKMPMIARVLLGLGFTVFGILGLLGLAKPPPDMPEAMITFNTGLAASVYFFPFLKLTETVCGLLLLSGFFVPLALVVLAPILLNIVLVHGFLMPAGLAPGIILGILAVYLAFFTPYSPKIKALFEKK